MKWIAATVLALLIFFASCGIARAELPYETIDDIQVPSGVTWGTQITWQGHAITKVRKEGNLYIVEVARDSEPHQLPYFSVSFDLNWNYIGTVRTYNPEVEKRMAEQQKKAEEDKQRQQQAEQERKKQEQEAERLRQEQERNKPKPEPTPPPDPTPTPPVKPPEPPTRPPQQEPTPTEPPPDPDEPSE